MTASNYRWVIVAAGGLLGCVAIGSMFSLPFSCGRSRRTPAGRVTGVSSAMTIGFLAMAFASMAWGALSDRFGARPMVLAGSPCFGPACARQAGRVAHRVSARVRPLWSAAPRCGYLCADDGLRDGMVRHASQPRRLACLGRHGHGADDHVAPRGLAGLFLRLADRATR